MSNESPTDVTVDCASISPNTTTIPPSAPSFVVTGASGMSQVTLAKPKWYCDPMFMLKGVEMVNSAMTGSTMQMRLFDYLCGVALDSSNCDEMILLLNVAITGAIRTNLEGEGGKHMMTNYPFAVEVHKRAQHLRKEQVMRFKQQE